MVINKKGSLEISIQAIVIVVLAMTLLGLGLVFIRNQFGTIEETTKIVTGQVAERIKQQMVDNDDKSTLSEFNIDIKKGNEKDLVVGIRNKENDPLNYRMEFRAVSNALKEDVAPDAYSDWFRLTTPAAGWTLGSADSEVRRIKIQIPRNVQSGTYVFTFNVVDIGNAGEVYAQEDLFINVRG